MKKYTLLRISAVILEIAGYMILAGGLLFALLIFGFSYNGLPKESKLFSSTVISIIVFLIWMFAYGFPLILAHIIKVALSCYDNTNLILERLDEMSYQRNEQVQIQSSTNNAIAQWLKDNPGKGINDYYSK